MSHPEKSNSMKHLLALPFLCGAALHCTTAEAAIYTYVDKEGTRWLTNTPKKGKQYKLVAKYGAPQKPRPPVQSAPMPVAARSYAPGNVPVAAAIPRHHCGGQSAAKLERKFTPHMGSVQMFARQYGVDEKLVRAVMKQESCFNASARSSAGAMGLMQLMPGTADQLGIANAWDPHQNIQGGVKYLAQMLREFNGDKQLALAAYNAGPGAVRKYNGVPPYRETRNYVAKIMAEYNHTQGVPQQVATVATGYQRSARVASGAGRGYGWARPSQEFSVFRGLDPSKG